MKLYSIRDWDKHFENSRSRELDKLTWLRLPNKQDGRGYCTLMFQTDGVTIIGAFILILETASKCEPRGMLVQLDGRPHTPESIGWACRAPVHFIQRALDFLSTPPMDWIVATEVAEDWRFGRQTDADTIGNEMPPLNRNRNREEVEREGLPMGSAPNRPEETGSFSPEETRLAEVVCALVKPAVPWGGPEKMKPVLLWARVALPHIKGEMREFLKMWIELNPGVNRPIWILERISRGLGVPKQGMSAAAPKKTAEEIEEEMKKGADEMEGRRK